MAILVVSTITSDGASIINSEARRLSRTMQSIGNDHSKEIHPWRGQEGYQVLPACSAFYSCIEIRVSKMRIHGAVSRPLQL